ncbi:MAG: hypothetical protein ACREM8_13520, partial [Vulcanimicrobiaceae bacterium]
RPYSSVFSVFDDALQDYISILGQANRSSALSVSAIGMLTHVFEAETQEAADEHLASVQAHIDERRTNIDRERKNIDAFERRFLPVPKSQTPPSAPSRAAQRAAYWRQLRDDLRTAFSLSLADLAQIAGVSKATLVYIDRPDRVPRPSTAGKLMDLHAVVAAVLDRLGQEQGKLWLRTSGLAELKRGGLTALDASAERLRRRRSEEALPYVRDESESFADPSGAPSPEARSF